VLRAPQVSLLTLCPLAQPEKAIGHESQIEPWLTLTTTLLDASETDERRYASKMNLENRENRGSSYQYMGWMSERISLRLPVAGRVFFFDIPSYRTMLHCVENRRMEFLRTTSKSRLRRPRRPGVQPRTSSKILSLRACLRCPSLPWKPHHIPVDTDCTKCVSIKSR
jgi:hypothetical protein